MLLITNFAFAQTHSLFLNQCNFSLYHGQLNLLLDLNSVKRDQKPKAIQFTLTNKYKIFPRMEQRWIV